MSTIKGKTVLITGGASGIGKIVGRKMLEKGAKLIVWDFNQAGIDATLQELSQWPVQAYNVDISDEMAVKNTAASMLSKGENVDILINNAGIVYGKLFHEHTYMEIRKTMSVNSEAMMWVTSQFIPSMLERNSGHICNIASSAGMVAVPGMSVYVASKFAAYGWSDSLRLEMKKMEKDIKITTVTPYFINTGMFEGVRALVPMLDAEKVSEKIVRGIERNSVLVSMPFPYWFVRLTQAILPLPLYDWVMGKLLGIYNAMDNFTGRK